MSNEIELSPRIEKLVWKRLGNTPVRKIAEETGLTREQVIAIREELLDSVDELTINQKRQKFLVELEGISQDARSAAESAEGRDKGPLYSAAVSAIKTVMAELVRMEKSSSQAIDSLNALRIRELLRLVDTTVRRTLEDVAEEYGLETPDLMSIFQGHLSVVAEEMEAP